MSAPAHLERLVTQRAGGRCEYCRMHQSLQGATFHVEHITPRHLGGSTELENLALACPSCNLHKGPRIEANDPDTGEATSLFHPRKNQWSDHFAWRERQIEGLTETGRATVEALRLNDERRVKIRQAEELFGLFPPTT